MIVYLDIGFQYPCLELSLSDSHGDDSISTSGSSSFVDRGLNELKGLDFRKMSRWRNR